MVVFLVALSSIAMAMDGPHHPINAPSWVGWTLLTAYVAIVVGGAIFVAWVHWSERRPTDPP